MHDNLTNNKKHTMYTQIAIMTKKTKNKVNGGYLFFARYI